MPTVSANDVGNPQVAGEYQIDNVVYQVDGRHIAAWAADPSTTFHTIVCTRLGDKRNRLALGGPIEVTQ